MKRVAFTIIQASSPGQIRDARDLLREYWTTLGLAPSFQHFSDEVAGLPGAYAPPTGRIGLAIADGEAVGCMALRQIDAHQCEAKRLYVKNHFRGHGVGRALLTWLIAEARAIGYDAMLADTLPSMASALELYERFGFRRVSSYSLDPTPGAIYLCLDFRTRDLVIQ